MNEEIDYTAPMKPSSLLGLLLIAAGMIILIFGEVMSTMMGAWLWKGPTTVSGVLVPLALHAFFGLAALFGVWTSMHGVGMCTRRTAGVRHEACEEQKPNGIVWNA
ncbi:MAG: hypothetical protein EB084_19250 [Proteobacteria bacterium]|nr:hypothetical protein [Pseudomonadota bacterium]